MRVIEVMIEIERLGGDNKVRGNVFFVVVVEEVVLSVVVRAIIIFV